MSQDCAEGVEEMFEVRAEGDICVIKVLGEITYVNMEEVKKEIQEKVQGEFRVYVLNLGSCTYINSIGFGYIVESFQKIKKEKKKLIICNLVPDVKKLFEITKMDTIIEIYKSEKEALEKNR